MLWFCDKWGWKKYSKVLKTDVIQYLCFSIKFMDTWLITLEDNYVCHCKGYFENTEQLFKKTPLQNTEPEYHEFREK